jgi:integrase
MGRPNRGIRLEKNEAGIYEIRWSEEGRSKRVSTRSTDAAEAADFLAAWRRQVAIEQESAAALTVEGVLDAYFREHVYAKVVGQGTAEIARKHLLPHFGRMNPIEIMPSDAREYARLRMTGQHGRQVQGPTVRRELGVLVAALNHAADERRLRRGDLPPIPLPESNPPRERWLTEAEVTRLIEAASTEDSTWRMSRVQRFVMLAFYTAGRRTALLELKWHQVDFDASTVHLHPGGRRTKKRRASVPMHPKLRVALERAFVERQTEHVLDHPGSIRQSFETAVQRAGLQDVTPHVLRHTAATHMLRRGVPLWQVAGILGDTEATVRRVYGKHVPDALREAVEALL